MDVSKEYIKMCEKAEEIQDFWKKKEVHIEDIIYINENSEKLIVLKEPIFHLSEYGDGKEREHICFEQYDLLPIPFTKFDKDPFYKYDCGTLNVIWLPRQDQLQEIYWKERYEYIEKATDCEVQDIYFDMLKECYDLREWYINEGYDYNHFTSMEQLWLAFVMKEKYNKAWNGEDWVKETG